MRKIKIIGLKAFPAEFCIIFCFIPFYFGMTVFPIVNHFIDILLDYWLLVALILVLINSLNYGILIDRYKKNICFYFSIIIASTFLNAGNYTRMLKIIVCIIMITLLMEYALEVRYCFTIKFISNLTMIMTVLNIISLFIFQGGIYIVQDNRVLANRYLLGMDNRFCCTLFPGFCFVILNDLRVYGKIYKKTWIEYILLMFTYMYTEAIGSLVAILVVLPIIIIIEKNASNKIFNGLSYFIGQTLGAYLITVGRIFEKFESVLKYLGKDITLSSRTYIWNKANLYIENKKMLGTGIVSVDFMKERFKQVHLHNQLLTEFYQGGYVGLSCFLLMVGNVYIKLFKNRNSIEAQVVALILFVVFIQLLGDSVDNVRNHLFWLLAIGNNIDNIIEKSKQYKNRK